MCNHEMIGHIEGMLNRDLRTTKSLDSNCARTKLYLRQWQRDTVNNSTLAECRAANDVSHVFPRKRKRFQQRSNSYAWNTLQRFKHIFTLSIYLISIINLPRTLSRPTRSVMDEEWWILPRFTEKGSNDSSSKCNILKSMGDQARIAKYHANDFEQKMPQDKLSVVPDAFFPNMNPDHKASDELNGDTFGNMDLNEFAVTAYEALQKYAVGLDVMLRNQPAHDPANLKTAETSLKNQLKLLLAEINDYITAFDITPKPDVKGDNWSKFGDVMDTTTFRIFRSLLIKQYVDTLNYVFAGFAHFNQTDCN